jgi:hypothetical protein
VSKVGTAFAAGQSRTTVGTKDQGARADASAPLRVLHVGCGLHAPGRLHAFFKRPGWQEIRLDIDGAAHPDIIASAVDMRPAVEDASCDAIWSSHVLEHLARHEVERALGEFRRVLVPTGFALIRCPDLETIAQFIIDGRADEAIYTSAAGPITPIDMLFGHGASIAKGNAFMRHGTGFTQDLIARDLLQAGFPEVRAARTQDYEIWAAAFMPEADVGGILDDIAALGLDLRE